MTTASQDIYPQVPMVPAPKLPRFRHRGSKVTGGWPTLSDPGQHVRARKSLVPYLAVVLVPLVGLILVLLALGMVAQPPTAGTIPPGLQAPVSVAPSPVCTWPADGS